MEENQQSKRAEFLIAAFRDLRDAQAILRARTTIDNKLKRFDDEASQINQAFGPSSRGLFALSNYCKACIDDGIDPHTFHAVAVTLKVVKRKPMA